MKNLLKREIKMIKLENQQYERILKHTISENMFCISESASGLSDMLKSVLICYVALHSRPKVHFIRSEVSQQLRYTMEWFDKIVVASYPHEPLYSGRRIDYRKFLKSV